MIVTSLSRMSECKRHGWAQGSHSDFCRKCSDERFAEFVRSRDRQKAIEEAKNKTPVTGLLHDPEAFAKAMRAIDIGELREDIDELTEDLCSKPSQSGYGHTTLTEAAKQTKPTT